MTAKLDLYVKHKAEYAAKRGPALVMIGPASYLAIDGKGAPGAEVFTEAIGAMYNVAFTVKMARKFAGTDYAVSKLEGLWWGRRADGDFLSEPRERWHWTLMIRVPEFIDGAELDDAKRTLAKRGKSPRVQDVQLSNLTEGRCVQMLHVGPYSEERASIDAMRAFAAEHGLRFHALHHEIYLSDPRRVAVAKLKTILRNPVRPE